MSETVSPLRQGTAATACAARIPIAQIAMNATRNQALAALNRKFLTVQKSSARRLTDRSPSGSPASLARRNARSGSEKKLRLLLWVAIMLSALNDRNFLLRGEPPELEFSLTTACRPRPAEPKQAAESTDCSTIPNFVGTISETMVLHSASLDESPRRPCAKILPRVRLRGRQSSSLDGTVLISQNSDHPVEFQYVRKLSTLDTSRLFLITSFFRSSI